RQRTWSLDGAIHTLASTHASGLDSPGHVLLRPVLRGWTSLLSLGGPLTNAQRYDGLALLFGALGVASLSLLFAVVRSRTGAWSAWLTLAGVAMLRDTERQIVNLDEKPLGMLLFSIALLVTARAYQRFAARAEPPRLRDTVPLGLAW